MQRNSILDAAGASCRAACATRTEKARSNPAYGTPGHCGAAALQAPCQIANDPALRFLALLQSALASGHAHVADRLGGVPEAASLWGWRRKPTGRRWIACGACIGWLRRRGLQIQAFQGRGLHCRNRSRGRTVIQSRSNYRYASLKRDPALNLAEGGEPDIFRAAQKKLGVEPRNIIAVGDTQYDAESARPAS